jgi:hypothetical protein
MLSLPNRNLDGLLGGSIEWYERLLARYYTITTEMHEFIQRRRR